MMYLRISDLAGSSGCVPYINSRVRRWAGRGGNGSSSQSFSQELGTAVHELIQYVLRQPPEFRMQAVEKCAEDLEVLRTTLKPTDFLKDALPKQFLERGLRVDKIMKAWEHGSSLLRICNNFLTKLETYYVGSENKWIVEIEVSLHERETGYEYQHYPPSKRRVFAQDIALHGSVDLVFRWNNIRVLGELKTGKYSVKKKKTWKDQVAIYSDIWKEKHPEHEVYGMVFHASERPIPVNYEYPFSTLDDTNHRVGGPQCLDCSLKLSCEKSTFQKKVRYY